LADLSDVLTACKNLTLGILYPPTLTVGGTATAGDVVSITATPQRGDAITASYTVLPGDTAAAIAAGLNTAWIGATGLFPATPSSVNGAVLTLNLYPGSFDPPPGTWTITGNVTGGATETLTIATAPSAGQRPSGIAATVTVGVGWPPPNALDTIAASLATAPQALVSVFAPEGFYRDATRYGAEWDILTPAAPTLTATVNSIGTQITISGTVSVPQLISAVLGAGFAPRTYVYTVQPGDTLSTIASGLAALINADTSASAAGAVVTIPAASGLVARIGAQGTVYRETSRQVERIYLDIWAPSPDLRTAIGKALTLPFSKARFIRFADLSTGWVTPCAARDLDNAEKAGIYRRNLAFDIEYPTIETRPAMQIVTVEAKEAAGRLPLGQSPIVNYFI
jgi:LysM repeat protein